MKTPKKLAVKSDKTMSMYDMTTRLISDVGRRSRMRHTSMMRQIHSEENAERVIRLPAISD